MIRRIDADQHIQFDRYSSYLFFIGDKDVLATTIDKPRGQVCESHTSGETLLSYSGCNVFDNVSRPLLGASKAKKSYR